MGSRGSWASPRSSRWRGGSAWSAPSSSRPVHSSSCAFATGTGLVGERHRSLPGEPSRVRRFGSNVVASIVEPPTTCVWRIADLELVACTPAPSAANEVLYDDARYFERGTPEPWIRAI